MTKSLESLWIGFLKDIYENGRVHTKDDSQIIEVTGRHFFVDSQYDIMPIMFRKNPNNKSKDFISWIQNGYFDINGYPMKSYGLADYTRSIYDHDKIYPDGDSGFIYTYPERLRALWTCDADGKVQMIDQINVICDRLKENIGSNRAIATTYQAGLDRNREDIPCLQLIQATVRNDELTLTVFFRSNDIYGAWVSNMLFLMNIGLMIEDELREIHPKIHFNGIDYHVSSAHIYKVDFEDAIRVIGV